MREADPATGHELPVGVQVEEHRAFGSDGFVRGGVPADEGSVVPESELTAPEVAAFVEGDVADLGWRPG